MFLTACSLCCNLHAMFLVLQPECALQSLLGNLGAAWGKGRWPSAAGSTLTPRHLELRLGQPAPGSQLPVFANPSWLLAGGGSSLRKSALDGEQLQQLSDVPSLASLRCEVSSTGRWWLCLWGWVMGGGGCSLRKSALYGEQLQRLSDIPSLASLRCKVPAQVGGNWSCGDGLWVVEAAACACQRWMRTSCSSCQTCHCLRHAV